MAGEEGRTLAHHAFSMKITSFDDLPMSWLSHTTANVEVELVDIGRRDWDADYAAGVRDKIVLTSSQPIAVFDARSFREGALGIVSSWSVPNSTG